MSVPTDIPYTYTYTRSHGCVYVYEYVYVYEPPERCVQAAYAREVGICVIF